MSRSRKKHRHIQLQLDLRPELMVEINQREERDDFFEIWSKAFITEKKTHSKDPFFARLTEEII